MSSDQLSSLCATYSGRPVVILTQPHPDLPQKGTVSAIGKPRKLTGILRGIEHRPCVGYKTYYRYVLLETPEREMLEIPEPCVMHVEKAPKRIDSLVRP